MHEVEDEPLFAERGLERLGYQVTIQPINPDTGELLTATA